MTHTAKVAIICSWKRSLICSFSIQFPAFENVDAEDPCLLLQDNDANLSQTVLSACSLLQSLKVESMPIPVRPDNSDQTFTIQISRQVHAQVAFNMTESLSSLFQHLLKITCVPIDTQAHVYISHRMNSVGSRHSPVCYLSSWIGSPLQLYDRAVSILIKRMRFQWLSLMLEVSNSILFKGGSSAFRCWRGWTTLTSLWDRQSGATSALTASTSDTPLPLPIIDCWSSLVGWFLADISFTAINCQLVIEIDPYKANKQAIIFAKRLLRCSGRATRSCCARSSATARPGGYSVGHS